MAKQGHPFILEMTIGRLSFYKSRGRGLLRTKSNLTRKRWLSDPRFAGSRQSAANLAKAAVIASHYYKTIPEHQRQFSYYRQLVGVGQEMLSAGFSLKYLHKVLEFAVANLLKRLSSLHKPRQSKAVAARRQFKSIPAKRASYYIMSSQVVRGALPSELTFSAKTYPLVEVTEWRHWSVCVLQNTVGMLYNAPALSSQMVSLRPRGQPLA